MFGPRLARGVPGTLVSLQSSFRVDNRVGVLIGVFVCIGFVLSTYPWPFYSEFIGTDDCPETWCASTRRIPMWLYSVAYTIVFGVGFALM